jgi:hypothetical protein
MTLIQSNLMNIEEALSHLKDLTIDDCGSVQYYERQLEKVGDIEHALLSARACLQMKRYQELQETQGDLVAESYLNSL